jgi:hypothetical protein
MQVDATERAQVGVAGRAALWIAILAGNEASGSLALASGAALLALPFAAGWMTRPSTSIAPAQVLHAILLIALAASFLINVPVESWWQQIVIKLGSMALLAALGRRLITHPIAVGTPTALRICFFVAAPLAVAALAIT